MSDSEAEDQTIDLSNPAVTTKYMAAAEIANKALQLAMDKCVPTADIATVCGEVDDFIEAETGKLYKKKGDKKVDKGIAFPCCISANELAGHFSPLLSESKKLEAGDVAKIDLAVHLDGFCAAFAHTVIVGDATVDGRKADAVQCAYTCADAVLRLIKPGNKNTEVTKAIKECANDFGVAPVHGVLSHEMKQHIMDGEKVIVSNESLEERTEEFEFQMNEVYSIDIVFSTGEGKPKETENRTTVHRRAVENNYTLKTQKARQFISEVQKRFPTLAFSLRCLNDETMSRVGVSEANRHELLHSYPVLQEKAGETIAQFKYTVLLLPGGTKKVTGFELGQKGQINSDKEVKSELIAKLLATSANPKKAKKKKKAERAE